MILSHEYGASMTATQSARRATVHVLAPVVVGIAVGALTAYGQGWLSDETSSLANSAGPWSVAAFLVARSNRRLLPAIIAGVLTLACCEIGYVLATEVRGGTNATSTIALWLTAAALAGPPLGVAGSWSTETGWRGGVGIAVLGGVLLGEGTYGWTTVADTTEWRYWMVETVVGAVVIAYAAARSKWPLPGVLALGAAMATAAVVLAFGRLA